MRLIDIDAFLERNKDFIDRDIEHPSIQTTIRELIEDEPLIKTDEINGRATWLEDRYNYTCSACRGNAEFHYDYCPNCGAKMNEKYKKFTSYRLGK